MPINSSIEAFIQSFEEEEEEDRWDIIAKLVGRSGSKLSDMDRSYTAKKSISLKEDDDDILMMMMMMRRRRRRSVSYPSISRPVRRRKRLLVMGLQLGYGYGWGRQLQLVD